VATMMIGLLFSASNDARWHADTNYMVPRLEVRLLASAATQSDQLHRTGGLYVAFLRHEARMSR
jgi:hypothetical protein